MGQNVMDLSKGLPLILTCGGSPGTQTVEEAVCASLGKCQPCAMQNELFLVADKPGQF